MSYAGAATNIVGGELQGWANVLDKWNMAKAYQNEQNTQNAYQQAALGNFNTSLGQNTAGAAQGMMNQGAANRMGAYNAIGNVPLGGGFSAQSRYNPSADAAYTNLTGQARAKLGGYSDWAVQQAINNLNTQRALDQISNFAGSTSRNVYPQQLYSAQHSMDDLAAIGQAISSIGGSAANYAQLYGSSPPSTTPTYYPMGGSYPGYSLNQGYSDPYGNFWGQGYNALPTGMTPG